MILRLFLPWICFMAIIGAPDLRAQSNADTLWSQILVLDRGPDHEPSSREENLRVAAAHLQKQISALQGFITQFPSDPRVGEAKLKLAAILTAQSRMTRDAASRQKAKELLDGLIRDPSSNAEARANASFLLLSYEMQDAVISGDPLVARSDILRSIRNFQLAYPGEPRLAALLVEVSTLFEDQPQGKIALLDEASALTKDPDMLTRIRDDKTRMQRVGQPLKLKLESFDGQVITLGNPSTKPSVLVFYAGWSPPSLAALPALVQISKQFPKVGFIGISLDSSAADMLRVRKNLGILWPTISETGGWESPLIRQLGVNALPSVWILDKQGRLVTTAGLRDLEEQLRKF